MNIIGNRVAVVPVEKEERTEGFAAVEIQDDSLYKGEVKFVGDITNVKVGDTIYFAKYSPDTHEVKHEGTLYKLVNGDDILATI